jgi:hypothetical protein
MKQRSGSDEQFSGVGRPLSAKSDLPDTAGTQSSLASQLENVQAGTQNRQNRLSKACRSRNALMVLSDHFSGRLPSTLGQMHRALCCSKHSPHPLRHSLCPPGNCRNTQREKSIKINGDETVAELIKRYHYADRRPQGSTSAVFRFCFPERCSYYSLKCRSDANPPHAWIQMPTPLPHFLVPHTCGVRHSAHPPKV